jgi:hypothetical protein
MEDYEAKKKKLTDDLKKIKKDFLALKKEGGEEFERDAKNLEDQAREAFENFSDKASHAFDEIKRKIPEYTDRVKDQFARASDEVAGTVQKKPIEALGVAGIIGLLAGLLISRR